MRHTDDVPAVAATVRRLRGVDNVVYGQKIVARLLQLGAVLRRVGIVVIVVFFAVAGIIISNTIRLTVFARRREIAIMQLVGATNTYIRLPFICEGLLDGAFGALVAIGLLAAARATLWPRLLEALPWVQLAAVPLDVRDSRGRARCRRRGDRNRCVVDLRRTPPANVKRRIRAALVVVLLLPALGGRAARRSNSASRRSAPKRSRSTFACMPSAPSSTP